MWTCGKHPAVDVMFRDAKLRVRALEISGVLR
jgi:hypothetical protein